MDCPAILVVDDDSSVRDVVAECVRFLGMKAEAARDGQEALEMMSLASYDALITDLQMPGLDGFELLQRVRRIAPTMPVIVMSAHGDETCATKASSAGASAYLSKPFRLDDFRGILQTALACQTPH